MIWRFRIIVRTCCAAFHSSTSSLKAFSLAAIAESALAYSLLASPVWLFPDAANEGCGAVNKGDWWYL